MYLDTHPKEEPLLGNNKFILVQFMLIPSLNTKIRKKNSDI